MNDEKYNKFKKDAENVFRYGIEYLLNKKENGMMYKAKTADKNFDLKIIITRKNTDSVLIMEG